MTKEAIKKLQSQTKHSLTIDDFDLIDKLDLVADEICRVTKRERRLLNQPVSLCGVSFFPLTVAKSLWFAEKCEEWDVCDTNREGLLIWLLTVENCSDALDYYSTKKMADKASRRLSRKLHCSSDELTEVYFKCIGGEGRGSSDEGGKDVDYGGAIACLLREYGGTPDKWLYETPVEMLGVLFKAFEDRVNAEQDSACKVSAKGGKAVAPKPTASLAARGRFRYVSNEIEAIWSVDNG